MQISFDPYDPADVASAQACIEIVTFGRVQSPHLLEMMKPAKAERREARPVPDAPPPPPPPEEPAADDTPPPPPPPEEPADVDANGEAWDAEKHSANRKKNKDGTWRARRGGSKKAPPRVDKLDAPPPPPPPEDDGVTWPQVRDAIASVDRADLAETFEAVTGTVLADLFGKNDLYPKLIEIVEKMQA